MYIARSFAVFRCSQLAQAALVSVHQSTATAASFRFLTVVKLASENLADRFPRAKQFFSDPSL